MGKKITSFETEEERILKDTGVRLLEIASVHVDFLLSPMG
jgi:hypothetical protein